MMIQFWMGFFRLILFSVYASIAGSYIFLEGWLLRPLVLNGVWFIFSVIAASLSIDTAIGGTKIHNYLILDQKD